MLTLWNSDLIFSSKCKEIEIACTACRKISLFSTTKKQPIISNLRCTNQSAMDFFENRMADDLYLARRGDKVTRMLAAYTDCAQKIGTNRKKSKKKLDMKSAKNLLNFVNDSHIGNCGEAAESVTLILNINGIKNVYVTTLKNGQNEIEHEICMFNRDGSPFNGKIKKNQTIIVDAWTGIVDFANNALESIKSTCNKYFYFNREEKVTINPKNAARFRLKKEELNKLKEQFPNFTFITQ